jgi:UDP-N-acetylglucosamine acyltransferase
MPIHPTAVVDPSAEIDATAEIGAYAVVEKSVHVGAEVRVYPHGYVAEGTTLGRRCQVHPFAIVGHPPQDLKWAGEPSFTQIGDETIIREHVSIHRGTMPGSATVVGKRCFIMSTGHIGHNCAVGDDVTIATGAMLAGHVEVGGRAFVSGNVVLHQFMRVGELAMIGGNVALAQDVPPFMLVRFPQVILGPNTVGLRRAGMSSEERFEVRKCYRALYRGGLPFPRAVERVAELVRTDAGRRLLQFLRSPSKRGFLPYRAWGGGRDAGGEVS